VCPANRLMLGTKEIRSFRSRRRTSRQSDALVPTGGKAQFQKSQTWIQDRAFRVRALTSKPRLTQPLKQELELFSQRDAYFPSLFSTRRVKVDFRLRRHLVVGCCWCRCAVYCDRRQDLVTLCIPPLKRNVEAMGVAVARGSLPQIFIGAKEEQSIERWH
jgi:hypothetical protein